MERCTTDLACSIKVMRSFANSPHLPDCDGDGRITCDDYSMIHFLGETRCTEPDERVRYKKNKNVWTLHSMQEYCNIYWSRNRSTKIKESFISHFSNPIYEEFATGTIETFRICHWIFWRLESCLPPEDVTTDKGSCEMWISAKCTIQFSQPSHH